MEYNDFLKKMMDFHKASFDNYFSTMAMLQDNTEKLWETFAVNTPGISEENKKIMKQWADEFKKNRASFKKAIDSGYSKAEAFFDFNEILSFQDQSEATFNTFLNQADWMPDDFKKALKDLADAYRKGREDFKKYVEENINHLQGFLSNPDKKSEKTQRQK
jgi:gas vesicle protein